MSGRRRCACPNRLHEHGCRRRYLDQHCHCPPCKAANSAYSKARYRRVGYSHWTGDLTWVNPTGTRRRLQALAALGWTLPQIAERLDRTDVAVGLLRITPQNRILRSTANRVADVYNQLCCTPPPRSKGATYARNHARRQGWVSALAWDDIDDPNEAPNLGDPRAPINEVDEAAVTRAIDGHPPTPFREIDKREAITRLHHRGLTRGEIARRLGMKRDAVDQYFARSRRATKQETEAA